MTTKTTKSGIIDAVPGDPAEEQQQKALVDRLAGLVPREELEDALKGLDPEQITGPGGLVTQLAGRVIETALGAELTEHPGAQLSFNDVDGHRFHCFITDQPDADIAALEVTHRQHAQVEDRIKNLKATGTDHMPFHAYTPTPRGSSSRSQRTTSLPGPRS